MIQIRGMFRRISIMAGLTTIILTNVHPQSFTHTFIWACVCAFFYIHDSEKYWWMK